MTPQHFGALVLGDMLFAAGRRLPTRALFVCVFLLATSTDRRWAVDADQPQYSFDRALASKLMRYCSVTYVTDRTALSDWTCSLCADLKSFVKPEVVANEAETTRALVGYDSESDAVVVAFRGTDNWQNWVMNFFVRRARPTALAFGNRRDAGRIHHGFYEMYRSMRARLLKALDRRLREHGGAKLYVTGHSLGAALATVAAADLQIHYKLHSDRLSLHSFGGPKVGDFDFVAFYNRLVRNSFRSYNKNDVATFYPLVGFKHVGRGVELSKSMSHSSYLDVPRSDL